MKTGDLRKQLALQSEQSTPDGAGGYALAWVTLATFWGDITPLSGNEIYTSGHLEGHVTHKITTRWRTDPAITTDMRLVYTNRAFNIRAVLNDGENNQWAHILVEEGVTQ